MCDTICTVVLWTLLIGSAAVSIVAHIRLGLDLARWLCRRLDPDDYVRTRHYPMTEGK
jgi:hypothetical protein